MRQRAQSRPNAFSTGIRARLILQIKRIFFFKFSLKIPVVKNLLLPGHLLLLICDGRYRRLQIRQVREAGVAHEEMGHNHVVGARQGSGRR